MKGSQSSLTGGQRSRRRELGQQKPRGASRAEPGRAPPTALGQEEKLSGTVVDFQFPLGSDPGIPLPGTGRSSSRRA